jgi:hypothetical protein
MTKYLIGAVIWIQYRRIVKSNVKLRLTACQIDGKYRLVLFFCCETLQIRIQILKIIVNPSTKEILYHNSTQVEGIN